MEMAGDEHHEEVYREQGPEQSHLVLKEHVAHKQYEWYNAYHEECTIAHIDEIVDCNKEKEKEEQRSSSSYFRFACLAVIDACH